jgi:hypothetical protein
MKKVKVIYDTERKNWSVMCLYRCMAWGTIFEVEQWLKDNGDKYYE